MTVTQAVRGPDPGAARAGRRRPVHRHQWSRYRWSLYAQVVLVNAAILLAALLLLLWTPVTVSAPVSDRQFVGLVVVFVVMVAANAALLKLSFSGLAAVVRRMRTLDVLRPPDRLPQTGGSETRELIRGFNVMLARLAAERRASTRRSVAILENERRRISQELHDEIGQRLTGILLQLGRIRGETSGPVQARVERVQDDTRAVMGEIGAMAWQARPVVLDDLGLLSALRALAASFGGDPSVRIDVVGPQRSVPHLGAEAELAAYRIAQEALTNAIRHSGATRITLELEVGPQVLVLRVTDDGRGLPDVDRESPGLRGMRERALSIGARLELYAEPPAGLRVELAVPTGPARA